MYLYRHHKKIIVAHTFSDDFNSVVAPTDAQLSVLNMQTGEVVASPELNVDSSGQVIAIFDRDALPLGDYQFTWESEAANAFDAVNERVVGYPYFAIHELRSSEAAQFVDDDNTLMRVRELVEMRIEMLIDRAFRPCRYSERLPIGKYSAEPSKADVREILSASINDVPVAAQINSQGCIEVIDAYRRGDTLEVDYIYGADMNAEINRACLLLAEEVLKNAPSNITSRTLEGGIFERFVVGGVGSAATSVPEVNEIVERYKRRF